MKKLKIYLDTSVIGGSFDDEFSKYSIRLIKALKEEKIIGVISEIVIEEIKGAPDFVIEDFNTYKNKLELIKVSDEILELASRYVKEKIISKKYFEDAMHIAFATIFQVDLLVSWNFKHIVNFNRINQFCAVNLKNGYKEIKIFSPMEVLNEEK